MNSLNALNLLIRSVIFPLFTFRHSKLKVMETWTTGQGHGKSYEKSSNEGYIPCLKMHTNAHKL